MTFPILPSNSPSGIYSIDNSLRFNDNDSAYLSKTFSSGNRKTWTWSSWVKRGNITNATMNLVNAYSGSGSASTFVQWVGDNTFRLQEWNGSSTVAEVRTSAVYRDVSAWYHIVVKVDTTQATASNRIKLYVNGEEITSFTTSTYMSQNYDCYMNNNIVHTIGIEDHNNTGYFDGYLAEVNFIDGQALSPTDFGEFDEDSGIWKPIRYTGTYGTNGFYLDFENSGSLGADQSGNGNNFTPTNLTSTDQTTDTPTNNFATMNPLARATTNGTNSYTFAEGNLKLTGGASSSSGYSTIGLPKSGKWYFEHRQNSDPSSDYPQIGITENILGGAVSLIGFHTTSGSDYRGKIYNTVNSNVWASGRASGDVFGWYLDFDNNKMIVHKNGSTYMGASYLSGYDFSSRTLPSGAIDTGFWHICCMTDVDIDISFNFGNAPFSISSGNTDANGYGNFEYSPTLGGTDYLALCTQNLATELSPTIDDGSEYFNTVLWSGNSVDDRSITGVGFAPDLVSIKSRNLSTNFYWYDTTRGADNQIISNATNAEQTITNKLQAFESDGFQLGTSSEVNGSTYTYAGWSWKANGGTTSSNTDGSITSTVQANTTAGFSIVTYTGNGNASPQTVGHGLSKKCQTVILKTRSVSGESWRVYQDVVSASAGGNLFLNGTSGLNTSDPARVTATSSSTFTLTGYTSTYNAVNQSGSTYVAYCFAEIEGYSKFGSYTANGSTDGPMINLSFKPAFVIFKRTDSTGAWQIHDRTRETINDGSSPTLKANGTDAEFSKNVDFLSNGIKIRDLSSDINGASGNEHIYMAFAESPFVSSTGIPVTAR